MDKIQTKLYGDLITLTQTNEAFYHQDFVHDGVTYRIFNYRLSSYSDFLLPGALECRGTMFELYTDGRGLVGACRLASRTMEKFFNLNENPLTMNLDLNEVVSVEEKADGSLVSTYMHKDELRLKSKGSLSSDQALDAMIYLHKHGDLEHVLCTLASKDYTVNLEWCSPNNRIVLGYLEPSLKILNVRHNVTGEYEDLAMALKEYWVETMYVEDPVAFVASIPAMTDLEGFVLRMKDGQRVKIKCDWYLSLHHAKDSINNPRRLFEAILDEGIDDLRSLFFADELAMRTIDEMQIKVDHVYNSMVKTVEDYYTTNKDLDRKSYAIKGKAELPQLCFGLAMFKYVGREVDYKAFIKGKWRDLGLKDTAQEKTDE